jgi:hypothetical protein
VAVLIARAAAMPPTVANGVSQGLTPRDVLSFAAWLETGRFFGVENLQSIDGKVLPFQRVLVGLRPLRQTSGARVGVGMIVLNERELIERAIRSVQSFAHEIVVVDGGSTDGM